MDEKYKNMTTDQLVQAGEKLKENYEKIQQAVLPLIDKMGVMSLKYAAITAELTRRAEEKENNE